MQATAASKNFNRTEIFGSGSLETSAPSETWRPPLNVAFPGCK